MAPCIVPTRATGDVPPSPSGIIAWAAARSRRIRRRPLARWRRHEAGIVAREERDDGGNLFRLADSAQRGPLRELGEEIFVVPCPQSAREDRSDRVDTDALFATSSALNGAELAVIGNKPEQRRRARLSSSRARLRTCRCLSGFAVLVHLFLDESGTLFDLASLTPSRSPPIVSSGSVRA